MLNSINLYINNNLFTEKFLVDDFRKIYNFDEDLSQKFEKLKGKMIWQFNPNFEKNVYWIKQIDFDQHRLSKEISRLIDDIYPFINEKLESKTKTVLEFFGLKERDSKNYKTKRYAKDRK